MTGPVGEFGEAAGKLAGAARKLVDWAAMTGAVGGVAGVAGAEASTWSWRPRRR